MEALSQRYIQALTSDVQQRRIVDPPPPCARHQHLRLPAIQNVSWCRARCNQATSLEVSMPSLRYKLRLTSGLPRQREMYPFSLPPVLWSYIATTANQSRAPSIMRSASIVALQGPAFGGSLSWLASVSGERNGVRSGE